MSGQQARMNRHGAGVVCDEPGCGRKVWADEWHSNVARARRKALLLGWRRDHQVDPFTGKSRGRDLCPDHQNGRD